MWTTLHEEDCADCNLRGTGVDVDGGQRQFDNFVALSAEGVEDASVADARIVGFREIRTGELAVALAECAREQDALATCRRPKIKQSQLFSRYLHDNDNPRPTQNARRQPEEMGGTSPTHRFAS